MYIGVNAVVQLDDETTHRFSEANGYMPVLRIGSVSLQWQSYNLEQAREHLSRIANEALTLAAKVEVRIDELNQPPTDQPPQPGGWEAHDDPEVNG